MSDLIHGALRLASKPLIPSLVLAVGLSGGLATEADAQVRFGPVAAYYEDFDFGIGARAEADIPTGENEDHILRGLRGVGEFIYHFPDVCGDGPDGIDCSAWQVNANGIIPVALGTDTDIYAGAGLNIARVDLDIDDRPIGDFGAGDTDIGLNLLAGLTFPLGAFSALAEASLTVGGVDAFGVKFGVLLGGS